MNSFEDITKAVNDAATWLRVCADWMLANDLDMSGLPGALSHDPHVLADKLDAIAGGLGVWKAGE